jgi:hypothetical protein
MTQPTAKPFFTPEAEGSPAYSQPGLHDDNLSQKTNK